MKECGKQEERTGRRHEAGGRRQEQHASTPTNTPGSDCVVRCRSCTLTCILIWGRSTGQIYIYIYIYKRGVVIGVRLGSELIAYLGK